VYLCFLSVAFFFCYGRTSALAFWTGFAVRVSRNKLLRAVAYVDVSQVISCSRRTYTGLALTRAPEVLF
jgi:hypothetical protein